MKPKAKWHAVYLIVISGLVYWLYAEISRPIFSDPHLDAVARLVEWSERIKQNGQKGRDCAILNYTNKPELVAYYQEIAEGKVNKLFASSGMVRLSGEHKSCLKNLELVSMKHSPDIFGNYEIVLRCESGGVGEEVKLGSFMDSCTYTPYLTKWDFPAGKYTIATSP